MGVLLGNGEGLMVWQSGWMCQPCPLSRVDLVAADGNRVTAVNNSAHELWHAGQVLTCDRDIEVLRLWKEYALLLSSGTDCLSAASSEGWCVTAKAGLYPQDLWIEDDLALVCGGLDGRLKLLSLPELYLLEEYPVPGLPERVCVYDGAVYLLSFLPEEPVETALLRLELQRRVCEEIVRLSGLPGAICPGDRGIWAAVGNELYHYPLGMPVADVCFEGFGMIRHMNVQGENVLVTDPLAGICAMAVQGKEPTLHVLYRGDVGQGCQI